MKSFYLEGIGNIDVVKRRGNKNLLIKVKEGKAIVSIPKHATYSSGLLFAKRKSDWIQTQLDKNPATKIVDGSLFCDKEVIIKTGPGSIIKAIENSQTIDIKIPTSTDVDSEQTQQKLQKKLEQILSKQCHKYLGPVTERLSRDYELQYSSLSYAKLKSRWGSCNSRQEIKFSLYLVQLPAELQEYVIAHELCHTQHMDHGAEFKKLLGSILPDYKQLQKQMKQYSPRLIIK